MTHFSSVTFCLAACSRVISVSCSFLNIPVNRKMHLTNLQIGKKSRGLKISEREMKTNTPGAEATYCSTLRAFLMIQSCFFNLIQSFYGNSMSSGCSCTEHPSLVNLVKLTLFLSFLASSLHWLRWVSSFRLLMRSVRKMQRKIQLQGQTQAHNI